MMELDCKAFLLKGRTRQPKVFLGKGVLKICSKFAGEHPCRSVTSLKLLCNFIEIAVRHGCFPGCSKSTPGRLLLFFSKPEFFPQYTVQSQTEPYLRLALTSNMQSFTTTVNNQVVLTIASQLSILLARILDLAQLE